jgi:hypothetical protein
MGAGLIDEHILDGDNITVGNRYSTPCSATRVTTTTAMAPVAPLIMPGRPPKMEFNRPMKNAEDNPMIDDTPATKANSMASGTRARATVIPERASSFGFDGRRLKN